MPLTKGQGLKYKNTQGLIIHLTMVFSLQLVNNQLDLELRQNRSL